MVYTQSCAVTGLPLLNIKPLRRLKSQYDPSAEGSQLSAPTPWTFRSMSSVVSVS